ncbi:MAG: response regulator [Fluviicola sp.]
MIRIAIAEDNAFLARGLIDRLSGYNDLQLKHVAANGAILLKLLEQDKNVELILMDIQMPEMDGIEAVKAVKNKYPQVKIIMLTVMDDEESIFASIRNGADGYLLKDIDSDELYAGIHEIMDGGAPMSPSIALKTLKLLRQPLPTQSLAEKVELSPRETEVLIQLSKGLNYNEIADNLNISNGTVRKHVENTYRKLQVRNKVEAIDAARKSRLI